MQKEKEENEAQDKEDRERLEKDRGLSGCVFDNLDNLEDIPDVMQFFPNRSSGCILITSRSASSKDLGDVIEVERMEKDEGLELLLSGPQAVTDDVAAERILARLDYLPLAIALVRAYVSKQKLSLVDFEEGYEDGNRISWQKHHVYGNIVAHYLGIRPRL